MARIAFLGLGAMGSRMARRLLDAGHELVVWNRSPDKAEGLVAAGATRAEDPASAAAAVDAVITMVADPDALESVTDGASGLAAGVTGPTTVIEMSTVGPAAIRRLAERLPNDVGVLDAPVLGSLSEVESGTLKVFVGGPQDLFDRWKPLFEALGSPVRVGDLGAGAAAKLVANTTLFGVLGVLGEALALARGLGLREEEVFEVLAATPLGAQAERRREAIQSGEFPLRFELGLGLKDLELIASAADEGAVDMRLTAAARAWFGDAVSAGFGERDYSAILTYISGRDTG